MTHFTAIILGFIEGATEFIPVSSSGHLIIVRDILGAGLEHSLSFDAVLQLSTSLALLIYFYHDLKTMVMTAYAMVRGRPVEPKNKTLVYAIVIGTIPAVIFGLLLENYMDTLFRNPHLVALALLFGSLLMWFAQRKKHPPSDVTVKKGIVIGLYQCLALIPGVSRSGATISGGLLEKMSREEAARFSFLLSIPILIGSGLKKLFELRHDLVGSFGSTLLLSSFIAFVVGLISINFLMKYLKKHSLNVFIWYRVVIAFLILIFL